VKSNDYFPDHATPTPRHRYMKAAPSAPAKIHPAKALPYGECVVVLPRVADRWAAAIKFVASGRLCVSEFTYASHYAALRAAFDWLTPAANEPERVWRDEFGQLAPRRQPRLKPTSITKESTP
jgi:hypothetical protein